MAEVCKGAPVAVSGWVLTDRHDLAGNEAAAPAHQGIFPPCNNAKNKVQGGAPQRLASARIQVPGNQHAQQLHRCTAVRLVPFVWHHGTPEGGLLRREAAEDHPQRLRDPVEETR